MANLDYLEGGYTPPKIQTTTEGGSFEDYAVTSNIFGMSAYNPQTNSTEEMYQDTWNVDEKMEVFKGLKNADEYQLLNSSVSRKHYELLQSRNSIYKEAEARIANDNPIFSFIGQAGMSIADPTVLVPGTLAFKGSKALVALNRIVYGAATGAATNVLQENVLASQTARPAQSGSAAFWGATLGGGIFAIGPLVSGGSYVMNKAAAKAYTEPSIVEKAMSGELKDVSYKQGDDFFTYVDDNGIQTKVNTSGVGLEPEQLWTPGEVPKMNKYIQPFVISPVSRLAKSKYPLFNRLGTKMQSSPIYRTMGGKLYSEPTNTWDIKQKLVSKKSIAIKDNYTSFIEAQKQGYKGNFDKYTKEVNNALDDIIETKLTQVHEQLAKEMSDADMFKAIELEKIVNKQQEVLNSQVKRLIKADTDLISREAEINRLKEVNDAEVARLQEEFNKKFDESQISINNSNYQARLNELLDEMEANFNLDSVNPHLKGGIQGYQKYVKEYAEHMQKIGMKNSDNLHPYLYKTRSWNLEQVRATSDEEMTRIIKQAFVEEPMNKALINAGKLTKKQVDKNVAAIVNHMKEVDLVRMMPDNSITVPKEMPLGQFLEFKNFRLNDKYLDNLIERDIVKSMEQYNYNMSGRVALQTMFGTDNLDVLRREVVLPAIKEAESMGATPKEIASLSDDFNTLFEQILGTHGLPAKPNAWGEKMTRMLMKFNYLTFGGGFGVNALADLGVVAFTNGLGNTLRHFGPALKAIRDLRGQASKTPWVEQAIGLGAASDFYAARALSRFDDVDTMYTGSKAERLLDKGGQVMQNVSGLQHITAMEEFMAIGGGTVDIVNTARKFKKTGKLPRGFEEKISRYGLTKEDLSWVAEQPLIIKDDKLIDFNWDNWKDKNRMNKFQTAVTKMMNDAVIRGDKTLLPNYMTSANPFMRLMTQFMRYPHIAYERVLLRGASKPTGRFLTGTMTSASIMASIYYIREQALIEAGVLQERDAKYAIYDRFGRFDEEALMRLSQVVLMKMPQFGMVPDYLGKGLALTGTPQPGRTYEENPYTAIGGVSASRFEMLTKGLKAAFDGEFDGMDAYYMGKSITPGQNFLQLDQVYNPMIKELIK